MMPMLRIWSLLETIFRMSAELLKRGKESYLSSRRDSATPYSSLLYVTQGNPAHLSSFFVPTRTKLLNILAFGSVGAHGVKTLADDLIVRIMLPSHSSRFSDQLFA